MDKQPETLTSNENPLLKPMRDLYRAYVRLLEAGKERIEFHGGMCDSVEQMERGDQYLIAANVAIQAAEIEQRHSHETRERCPDCHGEWYSRNGPTGAQETCKHPWHDANTPKAKVCQCDPSGQGALPCPVHDSQGK